MYWVYGPQRSGTQTARRGIIAVRRFSLHRIVRAIRWMDGYTLAAFNPVYPYRRPNIER
jgi:hypothetical protein